MHGGSWAETLATSRAVGKGIRSGSRLALDSPWAVTSAQAVVRAVLIAGSDTSRPAASSIRVSHVVGSQEVRVVYSDLVR